MGTPLVREIRHHTAETIGRILFFHERGRVYSDIIRSWIVPMSAASGLTKYLGWTTREAIWVGVVVLVGLGVLSLLVGWFDWRKGVAESYANAATSVNPYAVRQIELLEMLVQQNGGGAREPADHWPPTRR